MTITLLLAAATPAANRPLLTAELLLIYISTAQLQAAVTN